MVDPPKVINPSTNPARCTLTLLMWPTPLPRRLKQPCGNFQISAFYSVHTNYTSNMAAWTYAYSSTASLHRMYIRFVRYLKSHSSHTEFAARERRRAQRVGRWSVNFSVYAAWVEFSIYCTSRTFACDRQWQWRGTKQCDISITPSWVIVRHRHREANSESFVNFVKCSENFCEESSVERL